MNKFDLIQELIAMMAYKRPAYSASEKAFADRFLRPTFGNPDRFGNYIHIIGHEPRVLFAAHYDTVHKTEGMQSVTMDHATGIMSKTYPDKECLGADCTTGVWLQLNMIKAGVEGVYVCHAAEEIGGIGSRGIVNSYVDYQNNDSDINTYPWLDHIDAVISFDRLGTTSVVTHQSLERTCSDIFGYSLIDRLAGQWRLELDTYGSYTDSMEYAEIIPECTNISVGYYNQHTPRETQDVFFALDLLEKLKQADWGALEIEREPTPLSIWNEPDSGDLEDKDVKEIEAIEKLILDHPKRLAEMLYDLNLDVEVLIDQLQLDHYQIDRYREGNYYEL
tara:strand:- start:13182 stop:14183 length:1002 start_codon:yes stop_codon:yes gene_type:complete